MSEENSNLAEIQKHREQIDEIVRITRNPYLF